MQTLKCLDEGETNAQVSLSYNKSISTLSRQEITADGKLESNDGQ